MARFWGKWLLWALICAGSAGNAHAQANRGAERAGETVLQEAMADSIIAREEVAAGRLFDSRYRAAARAALASRSLAELASITRGIGPRILGDDTTSQVYTRVPPCRIIDTTLAGGPLAGEPLAGGSQRDFKVAGQTGFPAQGGQAGGCGIPFGPATSVMINFVAVGPAGAGDFRAFAFGSPVPNASVINYTNLPLLNIANGLAVPICNPAGTTCTFDLTVQADVSAADLVADVVGFFEAAKPVAPVWAVVDSAGVLSRGFHATQSARFSLGQYEASFDRPIRDCAYIATIGLPGTMGSENPGHISVVGFFPDVTAVFLDVRDAAGNYADRGFHLVVHC